MSDRLKDLKFLTIAEVADLTRVSKVTVYRWVHNGQLNAVRFGRSYRIPYAAVLAAMNEGIHSAEQNSQIADDEMPANEIHVIRRQDIA